ncbi:Cytidylate kinase [Desulfocicer vacuolatum DSM 3385]|uniref:Cytidylate kinase n=1 Tax=Desulfocicer vacuolatum DSM 3385 TaxID=1121400 RepID=A0A1W2CL86_9BACT|nr:cytidylate kinase-like family protein [Desulfocicer vacuolatum]SMC85652.1 Cytidylate kinase [Desulfocicer vacuolatum DSM 3385]
MAVITLSRDICSKGALIAEEVARELNYECISRKILMEASDQFNIPEVQFAKAIHDGPSVFEKIFHGKEKYIAFFQAALLNHVKKNNVVYHGLGGQFFLKGIPHVLKTRVIMGMDARAEEKAREENISKTSARRLLAKDDKERYNWGMHVYGVNTGSNDLYDLVLHLDHLTVSDCVSLICKTAQSNTFCPTPESQAHMADLALAARIKATLIANYANIGITSSNGRVSIHVNELVDNPAGTKQKIQDCMAHISGIESLSIHVKSNLIRSPFHNSSPSMRHSA